MSDYPMLISNKLHSFRNFWLQKYNFIFKKTIVFYGEYLFYPLNTIIFYYSTAIFIPNRSLGLAWILIFRRVTFVWVLMSNSREHFCTIIKNIHTKCGYFR